jgi:glycerophosphoryl diester phosphodiesterase
MSQKNIKVISHRGIGMGKGLKDNSLPALKNAFDKMDGIELDAVASKDDVAFLMHDAVIMQIPHICSWATHTAPFYPEKKKSYHLNGKIPRLSNLFKLISGQPDKVINIELKGPKSARAIINAVQDAVDTKLINKNQVIVSSFDHAQIEEVKNIDPGIKRGLIFWQDSFKPCRLFPWSKDNQAQCLPFNTNTVSTEQVKNAEPDFFVIPARGLKHKYAEAVHDLFPDSRFILWTPAREKLPDRNAVLMDKLNDKKLAPMIDIVITNHPDWMKKSLG